MSTTFFTARNENKYGFARFYYPGEEDIQNNVWLRKIELEKSGTSENKIIQLVLPADKLLPLSTKKTNNIINWKNFSIDSGNKCAPHINLLAKRAGWNQTFNDIKMMVNMDPHGTFIALFKDQEKEISLGSGTILKVAENLDWIGMILVHPELRRQGIAMEIMKKCLVYARLIKKSTLLGLDATPMGLLLYRTLGFKESFRIWRSTIDTSTTHHFDSSISIKKMKSVEEIMEYLIGKSISDKSVLFKFLFSLYKDGCFVAFEDDIIRGIVLSRPGRLKPYIGPLLADSDEITKNLLYKVIEYWGKKGFHDVFLDIPEYHFKKKAEKVDAENMYLPPQNCCLDEAIKPVRLFFRMYHIIDEKELKARKLPEKNSNYENAQDFSVSFYKETIKYMKKEREEWLPFLKCIGGPEWS